MFVVAGAARQAFGAKVSALRAAPKRSRSGIANGARRVTGAYSRSRPPGPRHIAAIDRIESAFGPPPIDAVNAVRADRRRLGHDAFAAPLPAVRLRPMSRFVGAHRRFRRMTAAEPLVLSMLAPKSAGRAIGWPDRLVAHCLSPGGAPKTYFAKAALMLYLQCYIFLLRMILRLWNLANEASSAVYSRSPLYSRILQIYKPVAALHVRGSAASP